MLGEFLATGFFVGRLGIAPGTLGTLIAVPLVYLFSFNFWTLLGGVVLTTLVGLVTSTKVINLTGEEDPEEVVIDEIAGYMACFVFVEPSLKTYVIAFVLFRIFDIFKPFPINLFEKLPGAYGVMLDDIVAGLITSAVMYLLFN